MYNTDWNAVALGVKAKAGWKCEKCQKPHNTKEGYMLTVHHLNAVEYDDRPENIIALCQRCHLSMQRSAWRIRDGQLTMF